MLCMDYPNISTCTLTCDLSEGGLTRANKLIRDQLIKPDVYLERDDGFVDQGESRRGGSVKYYCIWKLNIGGGEQKEEVEIEIGTRRNELRQVEVIATVRSNDGLAKPALEEIARIATLKLKEVGAGEVYRTG